MTKDDHDWKCIDMHAKKWLCIICQTYATYIHPTRRNRKGMENSHRYKDHSGRDLGFEMPVCMSFVDRWEMKRNETSFSS